MKKGISLIVLVITIIVIIILAGSVILSLSNNNPISQATDAVFLNDLKALQSETALYLAKKYTEVIPAGTYNPSLLNANATIATYNGTVISAGATINTILPSLAANTKYNNQFEIVGGKITYVGTDSGKVTLATSSGMDVAAPAGIATSVIAAGYNFRIALSSTGTVKVWGANEVNQLGDNTTVERTIPTTLASLTNAKGLAAGMYHSAALLTDNTVKVWGKNEYSQLGDGGTVSKTVPTSVSGITNAKKVACGFGHTAVVMNDGTLKIWGMNGNGQVGDGSQTGRTTPYTSSVSNVKDISVGFFHTAAVLNDGSVRMWGDNQDGQAGVGSASTAVVSPTNIASLTNVKQIACGGYHTLVLMNDGTVKAFGDNQYGQIGDGTTTTDRVSPVSISTLSNVKQISAGVYHSVAVLNDGTVYTWGYNGMGGLGDGTTNSRSVPTAVAGLSNVKESISFDYSTHVILNNGTVKAFGSNANYVLGDTTNTNRLSPVNVTIF